MENNELRQHLNIDNPISTKIWKLLYNASIDGNAVAMQWLISNLVILYRRVLAGNEISVEGKDFVLNKDTFQDVLEKEFFGITILDIHKVHKECI